MPTPTRTPAARLSISVAAAFLLSGCATSRSRPDNHSPVKTTSTGALTGRPTLDIGRPLPGHSVVMFSYSLQDVKSFFENQDPFATRHGYAEASVDAPAAAKVGRTYEQSALWHNVAFRDLKSGEEWLLLDRRGVISRWWELSVQEQPVQISSLRTTRALVFLATMQDTDGDGVLTSADAAVAILTGPDGRGGQQITPTDCQVRQVTYDEANSAVLLLMVSDTNGDRKFDWSDAPTPYVFHLGQSGLAVPTLSPETRSRLDSYLK